MTVAAAPSYDPRAGLYAAGPAFGGLPAPARAPSPSAEELELLVRFEHPAKFLAVAELPGGAVLSDAAQAEAYATSPEVLAQVRAGLRRAVRDAAARLLEDPGAAAALARLPPGRIVALGDSITDDLCSWAEILREAAARVRPELAIVNAGVSGDTTADVLRRLHGIVALRPALVVAMLGTNDCQRHGPSAERLVSAADGQRGAAAISEWLRAESIPLAWLTSPPVLEPALAASIGDRAFELRDADTREFAEALHDLGDPVIDTASALRAGDLAELLLPDGVHPSLEGQLVIARELLAGL